MRGGRLLCKDDPEPVLRSCSHSLGTWQAAGGDTCARAAWQEALPNATVKAVKAVNAVYQNVDLSRLMDRVLALSRNNILGAFPGTNPFGFQARNHILSPSYMASM